MDLNQGELKLALPATSGILTYDAAFWKKRLRTAQEIPFETAQHLDHITTNGIIQLKQSQRRTQYLQDTPPQTTMAEVNNVPENLKCHICLAMPASRHSSVYRKQNCKKHVLCSECLNTVTAYKKCAACVHCVNSGTTESIQVPPEWTHNARVQEQMAIRTRKMEELKQLLETQQGRNPQQNDPAELFKKEEHELLQLNSKFSSIQAVISGESEKVHNFLGFENEVNLKDLNLNWLPSQPCVCPFCYRVFTKAATKAQHIQLYHNSAIRRNQQMLKCPIIGCKYIAPYKSMMDRHVNKRKCMGYKNLPKFKCNKCGLVNERSNNIKQHKAACHKK